MVVVVLMWDRAGWDEGSFRNGYLFHPTPAKKIRLWGVILAVHSGPLVAVAAFLMALVPAAPFLSFPLRSLCGILRQITADSWSTKAGSVKCAIFYF